MAKKMKLKQRSKKAHLARAAVGAGVFGAGIYGATKTIERSNPAAFIGSAAVGSAGLTYAMTHSLNRHPNNRNAKTGVRTTKPAQRKKY